MHSWSYVFVRPLCSIVSRYYDGGEYVKDPQLYSINDATWRCQTLYTSLLIAVHCVLSRYLHIKLGFIILKRRVSFKDPSTLREQQWIHDHICLYAHPVQQSLNMVVNTLKTHSHTLLIMQPECVKHSIQPY